MASEEELFALFDDLESQAQAAYSREREAELADRSRAEYAAVTLVARLMASVGREVALDVCGVGPVAGSLDRVAREWLGIAAGSQQWIVRLSAVTSVSGASDRATPEVAWSPLARLGVGSPLRGLAEAGERCVLHQLDGRRHEGVLRRVGADFVEVTTGAPARTVLVALAGLAAVQSRG